MFHHFAGTRRPLATSRPRASHWPGENRLKRLPQEYGSWVGCCSDFVLVRFRRHRQAHFTMTEYAAVVRTHLQLDQQRWTTDRLLKLILIRRLEEAPPTSFAQRMFVRSTSIVRPAVARVGDIATGKDVRVTRAFPGALCRYVRLGSETTGLYLRISRKPCALPHT